MKGLGFGPAYCERFGKSVFARKQAVRDWPARAHAAFWPRRSPASSPFVKGDEHGIER